LIYDFKGVFESSELGAIKSKNGNATQNSDENPINDES